MEKNKAMQVWENEFGSKTVAEDPCGKIIYKSEYGIESIHGWEVDHINPVSNGGGDRYSNLQPLHWETNRKKADRIGASRGKCFK